MSEPEPAVVGSQEDYEAAVAAGFSPVLIVNSNLTGTWFIDGKPATGFQNANNAAQPEG